MNKILVSFAILSAFAITLPVNAVPASAWRTRSTSLSTREQCVQRAFNTLEQAGLRKIRMSGLDKMAVYGETEQFSSTIVCENGGALAAIFCTSYNHKQNISSCDYIAASMKQ